MNSERNRDKKKEISLNGEQQIISAFDHLALEPEGDREAAWERFTGALAQKEKVKKIHPERFFYYAAASFIVLVSLSVLFFVQFRTTTWKAVYGEISTFYLPDSSMLMLNADSKVTFRKAGWSNKRRVTLIGEAWFEVRKGKDFFIETPEATIKVLGTSFNVYSREGFFCVKCNTGKILVTSKAYRSADTLKGREALDIPSDKNSGIKKYTLGNKEAAAWIRGEFYYHDVLLAEVIKELERQFNVEIVASGPIQARHYSGYFKNDHLGRALEYVCTPMNLKHQASGGNTIRIS
jgi:ferric-dicitrate binding protein FerR (iron transport regulator)